MPFIELDQQLHPLHSGENLLASGPEADLPIPQLKPGEQITIRVESTGTLAWAVGAPPPQIALNGVRIGGDPFTLQDGDILTLNGAQLVYLNQAGQPDIQPAIMDESTIPLGKTVPLPREMLRVANGDILSPAGAAPAAPRGAAAADGGNPGAGSRQVIQPSAKRAPQRGTQRPPLAGSAQPAAAAAAPVQAPEELVPEVTVAVLRSANGTSHVIDGSGFRIGSEKRCDLVIPDASVSRLQAEISCGGGNYVIRDLGRVSTLVNGKKLNEPHRLSVGDLIKFGDHEFNFAKRPASAPGLVRSADVTPIFSAIQDAPTIIGLRRRGGTSWFTWFLILVGAGIAAAMYLL